MKEIFANLETITQSTANFKELRAKHDTCQTACIPYIGMYLTDLTFVDEGNISFTKDGLINFGKWRLTAKILKKLSRFQHLLFVFDPVPVIQNIFKVFLLCL